MITNSKSSFTPHTDDWRLDLRADDFVAQYRATAQADGGASTASLADTLVARLRSGLEWDVADGAVLYRDPRAAGRTWRTLSGAALAAWAPWALAADEQLPAHEWDTVADRLREAIVAQADARSAALPADVAEAERARAQQRRQDRRAEIEAERERLAAELGALDEGAPVAEPEPAETPRGLNAWRSFRAL